MKFMSDTSLSELVTKIKNNFMPNVELRASTPDGTIDLNSITSDGFYTLFGMGAAAPPGNFSLGYLIVFSFSSDTYSVNCEQVWIDHASGNNNTVPAVYLRKCSNSTWGDWKKLLNYDDYEYILQYLENGLDDKLDTSDFTLSKITGTLPITKGGTGATTRSDAYKNLSFEVHTCTTLSQDNTYYTDADSLTEAGNYYLQRPSGGTAPVISVSENPVNGWLMVIPGSGTQVKQLFYRFGSATTHYHIFVRTKLNTGWSAWERLFTTKDVIPIANGGTGATTVGDVLTNLGITTANSGDTGSLKIGNILVQWGRLNVATVPDSESSYQKIKFDSSLQYSSTPRVFVNSLTTLPNQVKATAMANTSGITLYIYSTEARSNVGFDWVTVGVSA